MVYVDLATNPHGVTIIAVLWPMIALSATFLGLRLYSKLTRSRRLWWDDYLITVAWILLVVSGSASTSNACLGFGLRFYEVPLENLLTFGILSNISGFTSVLAVALSKTSFALTLLRLTDGWMKWFIIALIVLLNTTHLVSVATFWLSCNPPAKTYNYLLPGECWPTSVTVNYSFFVGAVSAFCDIALALLPWRLLLRFNMYNKEKIGVAIAMSMGVFAGITCIVKLTTISLLYDGDFSYNSLPLVIWGFIEPTLTIVAASLPIMRHLFKFFSPDDDRRAYPDANDTAATTITVDATTTTTTSTSAGRNSVGGGRETRLAALRAQKHGAAVNAASASDAGMSAGEKDGESAYTSEMSGAMGSRDGLAKGDI